MRARREELCFHGRTFVAFICFDRPEFSGSGQGREARSKQKLLRTCESKVAKPGGHANLITEPRVGKAHSYNHQNPKSATCVSGVLATGGETKPTTWRSARSDQRIFESPAGNRGAATEFFDRAASGKSGAET